MEDSEKIILPLFKFLLLYQEDALLAGSSNSSAYIITVPEKVNDMLVGRFEID